MYLRPRECFLTVKAANEVKLTKREKFIVDDETFKITDFTHYLGHTQAPTSSERTFTVKTSHPFHYGHWAVAHNGVLTNYNELARKITDKKSFNKVDSSLIPALLQQFSEKEDNEIIIITKVLSLLKGTFGLWIYCSVSGNIYLARSGSTIYANFLTNDFSSIAKDGFIPLDEGICYLMTEEGLTAVGGFDTNSPFFII